VYLTISSLSIVNYLQHPAFNTAPIGHCAHPSEEVVPSAYSPVAAMHQAALAARRSFEFLYSSTTPAIGARKSPKKNQAHAFRLVVCAQYAQNIPNRKVTKPTLAYPLSNLLYFRSKPQPA
jgi:hypothetical protein